MYTPVLSIALSASWAGTRAFLDRFAKHRKQQQQQQQQQQQPPPWLEKLERQFEKLEQQFERLEREESRNASAMRARRGQDDAGC